MRYINSRFTYLLTYSRTELCFRHFGCFPVSGVDRGAREAAVSFLLMLLFKARRNMCGRDREFVNCISVLKIVKFCIKKFFEWAG